jgi:hypothetical protein
MQEYRIEWKEHINRMSSDRILKGIFECQLKGKNTFWKTFEMMEGFWFIQFMTSLHEA